MTSVGKTEVVDEVRLEEEEHEEDVMEEEQEDGTTEEDQGSEQTEPALDAQPLQVPDLYTPETCTLHFTMSLLPRDQQGGHSVLLGVRNESDVPIITMAQVSSLSELLPHLEHLYEQILAELPQRKLAMAARLEEERKRGPATKSSTPRKEAKVASKEPTATQPPAAVPASSPEKLTNRSRGGKQPVESDLEQLSLF